MGQDIYAELMPTCIRDCLINKKDDRTILLVSECFFDDYRARKN